MKRSTRIRLASKRFLREGRRRYPLLPFSQRTCLISPPPSRLYILHTVCPIRFFFSSSPLFFSYVSPFHPSLKPGWIWFRKRDGGGAHEFGATGGEPGALAVAATAFAATVVPATAPSTAATGPAVQGGPGAAPLPTTLHPRETGMGIRVGPDREPGIRLLAELPRSVVGHADLPLLRTRESRCSPDFFSAEDPGGGAGSQERGRG